VTLILPLALTVNTPIAVLVAVELISADDSLTRNADAETVADDATLPSASTTVTADADVVAEADTEAVPSTIFSAERDGTVAVADTADEASRTLEPFAVVFTSVWDVPYIITDPSTTRLADAEVDELADIDAEPDLMTVLNTATDADAWIGLSTRVLPNLPEPYAVLP